MAAESQQLVIDLEARLNKFEKAFQKASGVANDNWKNIENRGRQAAQRLDASFTRLEKPRTLKLHVDHADIGGIQAALDNLHLPHGLNFEHLKASVGGLAAGLGLSEVAKLSDAWTQAGNRIAAADVEASKVPIVLNEVAAIAERSRSSLEGVAQVFAGLNRAGQTFGASQSQALVATEAVTKALTLSGSTTQEIQGALSDLTQGLQAGVLQGQELRGILREVPDFATALAKELGVSVGQIKDLGSQGEITSQKVFNALLHAAPAIDAKFALTAATIEQAFQNLETAAARFVGQNAGLQTSSRATTSAIQTLANNFGTVANGAGALGLIIATRLISGAVTPLTSALVTNARQAAITAAAHLEFSSIVGTSAIRMGAATLAARGFGAALSLVGGPVGAVLLGVTAAATYYASEAAQAEQATTRYSAAYDKLRESAIGAAGGIKTAGDAVAETTARMNAVEVNRLSQELKTAESDANETGRAIAAMIDQFKASPETTVLGLGVAFDRVAEASKEAGHVLDDTKRALDGDAEAALRAQNEIAALANAHPDLQPLADQFIPLLARLTGIRATVAALKADIAGLGAPAAKAPDTSWAGKLDVQGTKDKFGAAALQTRLDDANNSDPTRARKKMAEILKDSSGLVTPGAAYRTGLQEIAIEDAPSGKGGHGRKAPKTDDEKEAEKHDKAIKDEIKSLEEESRKQDAEAATEGKSNAEKRTAIELAKLKVDAASAEGKQIETLIGKIEAEKDALAKLEKQRQSIADTANFFRDGFANALDEIIVKGGKASDVFRGLLQSIESAALKAAFTGEGPFGGLFGGVGSSTATNPAGGGIFGMLLKGIGHFADGGMITGPGGPRSDGILARVSPGEFVVNAAVAKNNLGLLNAINGGKLPAFADGGLIGGGSMPSFGATSQPQSSLNFANNITLHASGGTADQNQDLAKQMSKHVEQTVRRVVSDEMQRQLRPGNLLNR